MSTLRNRAIALRVALAVGLAAALAWTITAGLLTEHADFQYAYLRGDAPADGSFRIELGASYPTLLGMVIAAGLLATLNSLLKARRRLRNAA